MAFTTATVTSVARVGNQQFQGLYKDIWRAELVVDPASIAAAGEDSATFSVPGVAVGDHIVSWGAGVALTIDADVELCISAADTLFLRISNLNASSALDLTSSTWKVVIGRPSW